MSERGAVTVIRPRSGLAFPSLRELWRRRELLYFLTWRDVAGLRAAIAELLKNDAKRKEMSANCRRVAAREYALEMQARRYVELYEQVLS